MGGETTLYTQKEERSPPYESSFSVVSPHHPRPAPRAAAPSPLSRLTPFLHNKTRPGKTGPLKNPLHFQILCSTM